MHTKSDDIEKLIIDCRYSKRLIEKLLLKNSKSKIKVDCNRIKKAIYIAVKYHHNQRRETGEIYCSHPLEVTYIVSDYLFKTDIIIAAILHDIIEDTELTKEIIAKEFNNKIAGYVSDLTRVKQDQKITSAEIVSILYQENKKNLLLVKLCDRLHNMQTISAKSLDKIQRITLETLHTFIPCASYLKIPKIQKQLKKYCTDIVYNVETSRSLNPK